MEKKKLIYPGQHVCILGLGVTGRSAVKYCLGKGARVRVSDMRPAEKFLREEGEFVKEHGVEWEAGGHSHEFLEKCDLLLPSPGVDLRQGVVARLRRAGMPLAGELAVVAGELDIPVVAVTGTNGKTTVTTLIGEVLEKSGRRVFVGGNIGTPLYEYCLGTLSYDVLVIEVSSFQLECSGDFAADVALLLNITPDHLDRHPTMEDYIAAKGNLFARMKPGGLAILNGDDAFSLRIQVPEDVERQSFGVADGCNLKIGEESFCISDTAAGENRFYHGVSGLDGFLASNYAAAYLALKKLGLDDATISNGFEEFQPLPHRLEFSGELLGVRFVNDSKATNTGAVIGALKRYGGNVVLVAGGRDKGDDYTLLRESIKDRVHTLILMGEAAGMIQASLGDLVPCVRANSMQEAVRLAFENAGSGDTVLLSPACASFDMFASYGDRGNQFKAAVQSLICDHRVIEAE